MKKLLKQGTSRQGVVVLAALGILVIVLLFNYVQISAEGSQPRRGKDKKTLTPKVEVVSVLPEQYKAKITSYGEATPHYELRLSAQVSGQIQQLNGNFESGKRVKKGDTLVQLEKSEYLAAVASAENTVASAKLALLEEERKVAQAAIEWEASGMEGKPESALVLREPQLKAAKAAVKQADAVLRNARKDLRRTNVVAPFNTLIVERQVSPGTYVQAGTEIALLYSTEYMEVKVDLSEKDWRNLPNLHSNENQHLLVKLFSVEDKKNWTGRVLRVEQHIDGSTRQRSLIIAVDRPLDQTPALYPGTFLNVLIDGRTVDKLWRLPSSALSQRGEIWYVTQENTLANFSADPVFSDSSSIYIDAPEQLGVETQRVLFHPLSSYLKGMKVNVTEREPNHG